MDYAQTLNLPSTDFPMRGNLPTKEPEMLDKWSKENLYKQIRAKRKGQKKFILHDGPPYANGDIHMGTALNKVLKDIVVKYNNLKGFDAPYIPGWDTHGLPIEHAAIKILGLNRHELDVLTLRAKCAEYALDCLDKQRKDFIRLGVFGDWENPYITLHKEYEAEQIKIFGAMAEKGFIYKGLKTVYWCSSCETALAEAEIEYAEKKSHAIYVKFPLLDDKGLLPLNVDLKNVFAVIWTTTPWTLPANAAIALNADLEYNFVKIKDSGDVVIVAHGLLEKFAEDAKIGEYEIIGTIERGADLEGAICKHPFMEREVPFILGEHVTLEQGTGCVHTAPGHGHEDFEVGIKYKLPVINPVDHTGTFNHEAGQFAGLKTEDANVPIIKLLIEKGLLVSKGTIRHQYAHCWRCKSPIIYRATDQWFASVDGFRKEALESINKVTWIPVWGKDRITNMVADRKDWCISRQRVWGVPIPIFYCNNCQESIINKETIAIISDLFKKEGSAAWWKYQAEEILPQDFKCSKCNHKSFRKESDIMDVWFDSGSSHTAVCKAREELNWPADLYLEGSDQHRGWFQSSLLTSVAAINEAPYKAVLTHGFVVDGEGRKMSKSVGNVIYPQDIIKKYGADILRLWVASADYKDDISISDKILKQMTEGYRKIRNTFRYLLGNLADYNPLTDCVSDEELTEMDRWALMRLEQVREKVTNAYENYEFYSLYHTIHQFCVVDLSSIYLDVLKDCLYVEAINAKERRSAQTAMYKILRQLVVMISPILTFTAEEVWQFMPKMNDDFTSVHLASWPKVNKQYLDDKLEQKWQMLLAVRSDVTKALETARQEKVIGHSLDAKVKIFTEGKVYDILKLEEERLARFFIISQAELVKESINSDKVYKSENNALQILVSEAEGDKCARCWIYSKEVNSNQPVCKRCSEVLLSCSC